MSDSLFFPKPPVTHLDYSDYDSVRQDFRDKIAKTVAESFPYANDRYTLNVRDVAYDGPDRYTNKQQKQAILDGRTLSHKLTGKFDVVDNATGQVVSKTGRKTLINVPYLTNRGTYIRNGTEYTISKQFRLIPNVYTRKTDDGRVESQFNVKPRTGRGFRLYMEPETSIFYMKYAGRKIPLYPVLKAMGVDDNRLTKTWGPEILKANRGMERSPYAINFLRSFTPPEEEGQKQAYDINEATRAKLIEEFGRGQLDPDGTMSTLGKAHTHVTPDVITEATAKILAVAQRKADTDDRDSLGYQTIHDASDFLADKIRNDQNQVMRQLLWKLTNKQGDSDKIPAAPLDKHVSHLFNNTGLAQAIESINPMEAYDQNQRVVRTGEGGIQDTSAIPAEARNVQNSYLNFVDAVRAPESMKIGVDMKLARGTLKGSDGLLYTQFRNVKTGAPELVSSKQVTKSTIAMPGALAGNKPFVPAMVNSKGIFYVPREEVDYEVESGEDMFSTGANLVPLKSGVKGMRLLMGSKFGTAALPLVHREAPYVRTKEGDGSVESKLGKYMGAVRAKQPGVVKAVTKDYIDVVNADGTKDRFDLYDSQPFNRKTFLRNTPTVKPGDRIDKNQLLATSNYTDGKGVSALGTNMRVAYLNYDGKVFEDAIVISEEAAKKFTSEHMYTQEVEEDAETKINKQHYKGLFPARFSKDQLDTVDDNGVVKKGTILKYGDPMFLAVQEKQPSPGTMGRRLRSDDAVVWSHKYPGVVTDIAKTKKGYNVVTRANTPMEVGDKIAMRFGGKGVVSEVVKDSEMPQDPQGRPFDIIMSPLGVVSRTNSAQMIETVLGKIAEKTGKTYTLPGFMDEDMAAYAQRELQKHGLSDADDIYDPKTRKKIPKIFNGVSYFYKLQHTSESKGKSRSTAGYTQDEQPSRGGKTGCFPGQQTVLTLHGERRISSIVEKQQSEHVWTYDERTGDWGYRPITDWFVFEAKVEDILHIQVAGAASVCGGARVKHASSLYPTRNHEIYKVDGTKVMAGELVPGDNLVTWGPKPTADQLSVLFGSLLGDGYMSKDSFQVMHSLKQMNYNKFKQKVLAGLYATFSEIMSEGMTPDGKSHKRCLLTMSNKYVAAEIRKVCYVDGVKTVTEDWLNTIGDLGICVWILDDGSIRNRGKKKGQVSLQGDIATHSFDKHQVDRICTWLNSRLKVSGIHSVPVRNGKHKVYLPAAACKKLVSIIAKNIPGSAIPRSKRWLRNKVISIQQTQPSRRIDNTCKIVAVPAVIKSITPYKQPKGKPTCPVYDFTVADTHKYTAGSVLVSNSKHIGDMEIQAMLAHGGDEVLKDMKVIKGQKNDSFWRQIKLGETPVMPGTPLVYDKFKSLVRAAGVELREDKHADHIFGMTDAKAKDLTGNRQITSTATYGATTLEPVKGGLFDPEATGSKAGGDRWSYIQLPEPMPNPVMVDPLRSILGLTQKQFQDLVSGDVEVNGKRGGEALKAKLEGLNLESEKLQALEVIKSGAKSKRDAAVKKFRYLDALGKQGVKPQDFLMTRVPVLPPKYRPISRVSGMTMVADPNYMYKALLESVEDYEDTKDLPEAMRREARKGLYDSYESLVGMADPVQPELQQKGVSGILKTLFGKGSSKSGFVHRRLIGTNIDMSGLGVITPNPSLKLNEVGLPENLAWNLYEPFVIRDMVQKGHEATVAAKAVEEHSPAAYKALQDVVKDRPVIINRAPSLHKYSVMAAWPVLTKGNTLQIPPTIVGPFGADFDGDSVLTLINIRLDHRIISEHFRNLDNHVCIHDPSGVLSSYVHEVAVTNEEKDMKFATGTRIIQDSKIIRIEDIPRFEDTEKDLSDKVTEWSVFPGISIYAYDRQTNQHGYFSVRKVSRHAGLPMLDVTIGAKGRHQSMVTCSSDHSLVFYDPSLGVVRDGTPEESSGRMVPVVKGMHRGDAPPVRHIQIGNQIPASYDLGVFIGAMIGDGWVDINNQVNLASIYKDLQEDLIRIVNTSVMPQGKSADVKSYVRNMSGNGGFGSTADREYKQERVAFHLKKQAAVDLRRLIGCGAYNKVIPQPSLAASDAHLRGILAGLLATDGSVNVSKTSGKKSSIKNIRYETVSPYLRDALQILLLRLHIRSGVSSYMGTNSTTPCYVILPSITDFVKFCQKNPSFKIPHAEKQAALDEIIASTDMTSGIVQSLDQVPYPEQLFEVMTWLRPATDVPTPSMSDSRKRGSLSRVVAAKFVAAAEDADWSAYETGSHLKHADRKNYTPEQAKALFDAWATIVNDEDITWQPVTDIQPAGIQDCWDLTVPGPLTFALASGVIVMDTMSYSVPVSDKAVKQAKEKMLPSKNLIYDRNKKPTYVPSNEYLQGLYFATKKPAPGKVRKFDTRAEAMKAFKAGEIRIDDPIQIMHED